MASVYKNANFVWRGLSLQLGQRRKVQETPRDPSRTGERDDRVGDPTPQWGAV
jgi:hypothetical protein